MPSFASKSSVWDEIIVLLARYSTGHDSSITAHFRASTKAGRETLLTSGNNDRRATLLADWNFTSGPAPFQRLLDIVLEQVPDFVHTIGKIWLFHAFHSARTRHIDANNALDQSWPRTHHCDTIAKHNRFFDVMGDENHSFLVAFPDA